MDKESLQKYLIKTYFNQSQTPFLFAHSNALVFCFHFSIEKFPKTEKLFSKIIENL